MPRWIYLPNPDNPDAVVDRFQDALDAVLNQAAVKRYLADRGNNHSYQYVHPSPIQPAVGGVSAVFGHGSQGQSSGSLFVEIYAPGHHGGGSAVYVPESIALRLAVSLKGTSLTVRLSYDRLNRMCRAHLRAPLQTFVDHPWGVITLQ